MYVAVKMQDGTTGWMKTALCMTAPRDDMSCDKCNHDRSLMYGVWGTSGKLHALLCYKCLGKHSITI